MLVIDDSSNVYVVCIVGFDPSNVVYLVVLVRLSVVDSSNVLVRFVWLIVVSLSNMLDVLVVVVMYVVVYEGRANYQYYALQGSE